MSLIIRVIFFTSAFMGINLSMAQTMDQQMASEPQLEIKLKRLSFVLRGMMPKAEEFRTLLDKAKTIGVEKALEEKLDEYLNSYEFAFKFSNKVADIFRVGQTPFNYREIIKFNDYKNKSGLPIGLYSNGFTAFHLLIRDILENNKPWSEILNQKSYIVMYKQRDLDFELYSGVTFYSQVAPELAAQNMVSVDLLADSSKEDYFAPSYTAMKIDFKNDDKRIAGALTTPSFLARYTTTGVNKNRKRAAAVLRTFLCKNMVAAIPVPKQGVDENKKLALIGEGEYTENDLINHTKMTNVHGENVDCQQCHKQLDPLGNVFNFTPTRLGSKESGGGLVYYDEDGNLIKKALLGIGDLGPIITNEKDYFSCQVNYFWHWVYGETRLLTPKDEIELVQVFKKMDQKPKDFIKFLVLKKEFYKPIQYSENQLSSIAAYKTLKKCQSCHNQQTENTEVRNLNWLQLIENKNDPDRLEWVRLVAKQIEKNKMPPQDAKKDFTDSEMIRLKKWLASGAPDFEGN